MGKPELVKSKPAGPEKESWYRYRLKEEQETPKRLEDAAKFLAFMISVSLTIFLSVSGAAGKGDPGFSPGSAAGLTCWILSLLLSFFVLFPFRYRFSSVSIRTFQQAHQRVVRVKGFLLILSLIFFFVALLLMVYLFLSKA